MKYQNKRNGKVATVIDQDKQGLLTLQYEDGNIQHITESTRKRWFKPVDEEQDSVDEAAKYVEISQSMTKELNKNNSKSLQEMVDQQADQDTCEDGTPYSEVGKEIAEQAKEKAEVQKSRKPKKVKSHRVSNPEVAQIVAYIEGKVTKLGGKIFTPDKAPKVRLFKVNDHMFARINISGSHVSLCCRSCAVDLDSLGCAPDKTQNHMFDAIYIFEDLTKTTLIDSIIDQSFGYQKEKNTLKKTKKEEK